MELNYKKVKRILRVLTLNNKRTYTLVVLMSFISAAIWAIYIKSTATKHGLIAAIADFHIMFLSSVVTQLWAIKKQDIKIFLVWDLTSAIGTFIAVQYL